MLCSRELEEECGMVADTMEKVGNLIFEFVGDPQLLEVHVFNATKYHGTPTESDGELFVLQCLMVTCLSNIVRSLMVTCLSYSV